MCAKEPDQEEGDEGDADPNCPEPPENFVIGNWRADFWSKDDEHRSEGDNPAQEGNQEGPPLFPVPGDKHQADG